MPPSRQPMDRRASNLFRIRKLKIDAHMISLEDLAERYETDLRTGLSRSSARKKLEKNGLNALSDPVPVKLIKKFLKHIFCGFSILLWIGAGLCMLAYVVGEEEDDFYMANMLIFVVVVIGTFTCYHDHRSFQMTQTFQYMIPHYAQVIRAGEQLQINSNLLVLGDLVELKPGDRVPADMRLIEAQDLKVDNSSITKELDPQFRSTEFTSNDPLYTENLVFFKTNVVEGYAKGVVIACGDKTVAGQLAERIVNLVPEESLLVKEIRQFIKIITLMAIIPGVLFSSITMVLGYNWVNSVVILIAIVISNVPEGMLATITKCLALTGQRLVMKNCLVKNLEAVVTLGSVSTICTDQTGMLSQNRMYVSHTWYNDKVQEIGEGQVNPNELNNPVRQSLLMIAALCSRAEYMPGQEEMPIIFKKVNGTATEAALLKYVDTTLGNVMKFRKRYPKIAEIPFTSSNMFQVSLHLKEDKSGHFIVMKGAPEIVENSCSTIYLNNKVVKLTNDLRLNLYTVCEQLADGAERVLGFADCLTPKRKYPIGKSFTGSVDDFLSESFRFVGFISMLDPPRTSVPDAIDKCRMAGIKVIMITGDHPTSAKAFAKKLGIIRSDGFIQYSKSARQPVVSSRITQATQSQAIILQGNDLDTMSDKRLERIISRHSEIVCARTAPHQKVLIVEACQRQGEIVAATGDDITDATALRAADVGIARAFGGTDISHDNATVILLDDNFSSIVSGIAEGRLVYDNLKKSLAYSLASNIPEIAPFLAFIVWNIPLPLGAITVLFIDLGTEMMPTISLAYEKAEEDLMKRPPRNTETDNLVTERMISLTYGQIGFIQFAGAFFTYLVVMGENGFLPDRLHGLRKKWDTKSINDLEDSYGQEWTYTDRKLLEYNSHTAYFIAIMILQWADLIICKTRRYSIFQHGMTNYMLNFALVFETILAVLLCYVAEIDETVKIHPIKLRWWLPALPFSLLMIVYDEMRKCMIRRSPNGWVARETYY